MRQNQTRVALVVLQWVLGLVILEESAKFAFSTSAARAFAATGMPNFVHIGLAWSEMVAAVIFLIPRALIPKATIVGGWLLLIILAFAVVAHLLHGWFDVGVLVLYAAAAWAVMSGSAETASGL
jgi:hypothetical protein